jgi:hypothetical protein
VYRRRVDINQGGCASCFGGVDMWLRRGTFLLTLILAGNICYRGVDITIHNAKKAERSQGVLLETNLLSGLLGAFGCCCCVRHCWSYVC